MTHHRGRDGEAAGWRSWLGRGRSAAALLALLLASCEPSEPASWPSNQQSERLAELICSKKEACCSQRFDGNRERCLAIEKLSASTRAGRIQGAVEASRASYDDARFEACLRALADTSCDGWFGAAAGLLPAPCLDYTQGRAPDGAPCDDYFECASGHCAYTPTGENRTCRPRGQSGEACQGTDDECATELQCWAGACIQRLPAGSTCIDHDECSSGECGAGVCIGACKLSFL